MSMAKIDLAKILKDRFGKKDFGPDIGDACFLRYVLSHTEWENQEEARAAREALIEITTREAVINSTDDTLPNMVKLIAEISEIVGLLEPFGPRK